jgi:ABC-2 type transport system permease protein
VLRSVFAKTLWDQRRGLLAAVIGVTAVGVLYAAFYPVINTPEMRGAVAAFPPALLEAMGITDMTSPAGYLGGTSFGLLGPILIIIIGAVLGATAIAGEEENGRLDLTLAHPVSRWSVLIQRFAALVVGLALACLGLALALVAISGPAQLTEIPPANLVAAALHMTMLGTFFGVLAMAVGAASGRRAWAFTAVAVIGVAAFFGNNLGPSVDWLAWTRDVSPFHYYSGGQPLVNGAQPVDLTVLAVASLAMIAIGGLIFDRRDVAV